MNVPANLGQRILDLARIAAAMHREQSLGRADTHGIFTAGGAGAALVDPDGRLSTDGIAPGAPPGLVPAAAPSRLR